MKKNNSLIYIIIFILILFGLVFVSTYAYFSAIYDKSGIKPNKVNATAEEIPMLKLVSNIEELKINLDSNLMKENLVGTIYFATPSGTPVTLATLGNGRYVLATASVDSGNIIYDCSYTYKITASITKAITDGSDESVKIKFKNPKGEEVIYSLKEVLNGIEYTSKIKELKIGEEQTILVEAYVENATDKQDDLIGNIFTFNIDMVKGSDGFSCTEHTGDFNLVEEANGKSIAAFMVANNSKIKDFWNSSLEGDGYRFVGTGPNLCSYNFGAYKTTTMNEITECPKKYNYIRTTISSGETELYTYQTSCPEDDSYYTYECTEYSGLLTNEVVDNYICFGTTNKSECTNNPGKYMYRIIGVFPDESGKQHLKLISAKQLGQYSRHSTNVDVTWQDSDLYQQLNGEYFLDNADYDYLKNNTWSNKIENWKWNAVNTLTSNNSGPDYFNSLSPSEIYLHEMNRNSKTSTIGEWTYPIGKISLMYASDYALSLGNTARDLTGTILDNDYLLKTGWMHQSNNDTSKYTEEWTMAYYGSKKSMFTSYNGWFIKSDGRIDYYAFGMAVRPVFYLTSDVSLSSGEGSQNNPYIIG